MRAVFQHPYRVAAAALVLEAVCAFVGFGSGIDGLQALTRYSGRGGLFLFAAIFVLAPWQLFAPSASSRFALARRRQLGLAFGAHHLVHLAILLTYVHEADKELNVGRAAGGMLGYVFLVAMMATSSDAAVKKLGAANWKRLHRIGLWYLWLVFLLTYVPRLQGKVAGAGGGMAEFVVCTALIVAIAAARVAADAVSRRSRAGSA